MTIVEFYDKSPINNILSALACKPQRVIYVGSATKKIAKSLELFKRFFENRGVDIELIHYRTANSTIDSMVDTLEKIIADYDDCIFDLTGGKETDLVAIGILMQRHRSSIQCHRINQMNNTIVDCDLDGNVSTLHPFDISVEEYIILHGGNPSVMHNSEITCNPEKASEAVCQNLEKMWSICSKNPARWNSLASVFAALNAYSYSDSSLTLCAYEDDVCRELARVGIREDEFRRILKRLDTLGLISNYNFTDYLEFEYSDEVTMQCLSTSGFLLELRIATKIAALRDANGEPIYHDTRVGVVIDWLKNSSNSEIKVLNEIDVITIKDSYPIFISCKNGQVTIDELYKLKTVADTFGSAQSKKVLFVSGLSYMGRKGEHLKLRAQLLGIKVIDSLEALSSQNLNKLLKSLHL